MDVSHLLMMLSCLKVLVESPLLLSLKVELVNNIITLNIYMAFNHVILKNYCIRSKILYQFVLVIIDVVIGLYRMFLLIRRWTTEKL